MKIVLAAIRWMFAVPLVGILLTFFAVTTTGSAVFLVFNESEAPKKWIAESGFYENAVDIGIKTFFTYTEEEAGTRDGNDSLEDLDRGALNKELVRRQVNNVFPPEWIREQVETVIDSVYAFLSGDTDSLRVRIDFSGREETARSALGNVFKERVASLPPCPENVIGSLKTLDLFSMTCLPQNLERTALNRYIDSTLANVRPFYEPSFGLVQFEKEAIDGVIPILRIITVTPHILLFFAASAFLFIALVYMLIPGNRAKMIVLGILFSFFALASIGIGIAGLMHFDPLYDRYIQVYFPHEAEIIAPYAREVAEGATSDLALFLLLFGIVYAVIAVLLFLLSRGMQNEHVQKRAHYFFLMILLGSLIASVLLGLSIVLTFQTLDI